MKYLTLSLFAADFWNKENPKTDWDTSFKKIEIQSLNSLK